MKMEKNRNSDRHVVVSGISRGLGLAIAKDLLGQGYKVSGFSRKLSNEVTELKEHNPDCLFFKIADASDSASLQAFCTEAITAQGSVYGLVNNSAIAVEGILATLPEVEIERMLDIDLKGPLVLTRMLLRDLLSSRQGGRIINISSIVGSRGYVGLATYSACKAGLDGFSRSLAREVGRRGITVNSIAPGYMETEMSAGLNNDQFQQIVRRTPLGRLATVQDIVPMVGFLLSDGAAMITGQTLTIDGGITC